MQVVVDVGTYSSIDEISELGIIKGSTVFFDQAAQFIKHEVLRVDTIIDSRQDESRPFGAFHKFNGFSGLGHAFVRLV
jgi:hypothetical protein